jgi:hypothetical protein
VYKIKHPLRSNMEGFGCKTQCSDSEGSSNLVSWWEISVVLAILVSNGKLWDFWRCFCSLSYWQLIKINYMKIIWKKGKWFFSYKFSEEYGFCWWFRYVNLWGKWSWSHKSGECCECANMFCVYVQEVKHLYILCLQVPNNQVHDVPVAIIASNRPHYLYR